MKKLVSSVALAALAAEPALAVDATPFFSFSAGVGSWSSDVGGDLGDTDTSVSDLGLKDESSTFYYAAFEHAVPIIPQVRLESVSISTSGNATLSDRFTFGDQNFDADIATEIDLSMTDLVMYYEIAMLDFGLTARQFDAEVSAVGDLEGGEGAQASEREEVDGVLPMLYLGTRIDLPTTGFYVAGNLNGISVDGKSVTDYRGAVGYGMELSVLAELGVELGYRTFEIDLGDDEDFAGNIDFSGVYFGANIKF